MNDFCLVHTKKLKIGDKVHFKNSLSTSIGKVISITTGTDTPDCWEKGLAVVLVKWENTVKDSYYVKDLILMEEE